MKKGIVSRKRFSETGTQNNETVVRNESSRVGRNQIMQDSLIY